MYTPDGRRILTIGYDDKAKLWDAETGRELLTLPRQSTAAINSIAFSPDGLRLLSGNGDGTVEMWEAATPDQVRVWQEADRTIPLRH